MTTSGVDVRQALRSCSEAVLGGWCQAVRHALVAVHSPSELRSLLLNIWDQVAAFLLSADGQPRDAAPIGASLARLGTRPSDLGKMQQVLISCLLRELPSDVEHAIQERLSVLVEGLTSGFVAADRERLLEQQEEIRAAYARTLRQTEDRLRLMNAGVESSINALVMLDLQGRVTYVNPAFLEMWGYEAETEVLGRHVSEFGEWEGNVERGLQILAEKGGWVGELVAVRRDGTSFDVLTSASVVRYRGDQTRLMAFFVDITDRLKAQEALAQRADQAAFLNRIGEEIAGERTEQGVLTRAATLAHKTFDLQQVAILMLDDKRETLQLAALAGQGLAAADEGLSIPVGTGITGWAARENRTAVANDVNVDPRYAQVLSVRAATRSEVAVPICSGDGIIGVLDAQSSMVDAFGAGEQDVLETLADQIGVAVENARLYKMLEDELTRRKQTERALWRIVQRLETVHEIDQAILGAQSIGDVAEALLRNLRKIVPCQRASIDLFDFEANEIVVVAAVQTSGEGRAMTGARFPLTQHQLLFDLLGQREVAYVRDLLELPQSSPLVKSLRAEGIRSALLGAITVQDELIGMLGLGSDRVDGFEVEQWPIVRELADTAGIAMQQARLFEAVQRHRERLRRAMSRLAQVEETERRRVVRELHDRVGQNLTALDLNLSLVQSQLEGHGLSEMSARLDDSLGIVADTNRRIRQLMIDLRPPVLDDYGLLSALHWYADRFSVRAGIPVAVRGQDDTSKGLPSHVENALFRIAQEALNNIARHARAQAVTIALAADEAALRLIIADDGQGFDPGQQERGQESWGLLTMRERAESVGARCRFDSMPGEGTRVVVEMPVGYQTDPAPPTP